MTSSTNNSMNDQTDTTADNPKVEQIRQRVRTSLEELQQLMDGPLTVMGTDPLYEAPAPGEWTIMENLAHICELMPYWADEIAGLVAAPGQNFGRTMQHEGRLQAIHEHSSDTLAQIQVALPDSYAHLDHVLQQLHDHDLELVGQHSKFGERPLAWFIQEFVTDHLANHVTQINTCLLALEKR